MWSRLATDGKKFTKGKEETVMVLSAVGRKQEYLELQHPPLPPKLAAKVIPYWNRIHVSLGLTIGLGLLNLVLGLATGLIGMNYIYRKCMRGEQNLLKKGQCLVQKTQPNCDNDDDDREGEKLLGKQEY